MFKIIIIGLALFSSLQLHAQMMDYLPTEDYMHAQTSSIEQFIERFNFTRIFPEDPIADSAIMASSNRKAMLEQLFEMNVDTNLVKTLVEKEICIPDDLNTLYIEAELDILYKTKLYQCPLTLILNHDRIAKTFNWVFKTIQLPFWKTDWTKAKRFINPSSHETGFQALPDLLKNHDLLPNYFYTPPNTPLDPLQIFHLLVQNGIAQVKKVGQLRYFIDLRELDKTLEIKNFPRQTNHSGWLIIHIDNY